jgi:6-pyruvoyltetrahydropterin/6-carboxytetrahydropterin synthase
MVEITKIIEWDMGHRVPNHKSKCRNPHGHRYRMEVTVSGPLIIEEGNSSEGMVYDFGDIKEIMKAHVHDVLDHGFMIYKHDELCGMFEECSEIWNIITVDFIPTAENIVKWCYDQMESHFPPGIRITRVRLFETPNSWADYKP